eukprot:3470841-Pleurochrysis_carterae.AAC.1
MCKDAPGSDGAWRGGVRLACRGMGESDEGRADGWVDPDVRRRETRAGLCPLAPSAASVG